MTSNAYEAYDPLGTPKPFADDVWIVDGPEIGMTMMGLSVPFPTRMTVVRLPSGDLWVHSPIAWTERLAAELAALGRIAHLVAPNTLHYWYLPDWRERHPGARTYGPPGLEHKAKRPLVLDETLGVTPPAAWQGCFDQCIASGPALIEVDFVHLASRTLILTDLIENFEPHRVRNRVLRWLIRRAGAADPDGKAPVDLRLSFLGSRRSLRGAVARMLEWEPERIIVAHGRCYGANGAAELRRAFRWVL